MTRKQFSKQEKTEYFKQLRQQWHQAKQAAEGNAEITELYKHLHNMGIGGLSTGNIALVLDQLQQQGLDGLPYLDTKTFDGWKKAGYKVTKGQRSTIHSITWVNGSKGKKDDDNDQDSGYRWPKITRLFHKSQVEPIT